MTVIKIVGVGLLLGIVLYSLVNGMINFFNGYHALDIAQNFMQLGYTQDVTLSGQTVSLKEAYLSGLNMMHYGYEWLLFGLISTAIFSFVVGSLVTSSLLNKK